MVTSKQQYGEVYVVKNEKYQYGVMNSTGDMIVPFGRYAWISRFDHGLARVKNIFGEEAIDLEKGLTSKAKWGIIDEAGNEVLPIIYDEIWNFLQKGRHNTKVFINGEEKMFDLNSHQISTPNSYRQSYHSESYDSYDDYGTHYGEYAGTYAQDVMGYSDDVINDAFDGDPDAYWNID